MFSEIIAEFESSIIPNIISVILNTAPIWIPFYILGIFSPLWVRFVRAEFISKQKTVLLEIRLPKEVYKSPAAMELFLTSLHQTGGEGNWYQKYWLGMVRPWFSLEITSVEGVVRFYVWLRQGLRNFVESALYAQFPGIEIHEAEDYSLAVKHDPKSRDVWGTEFEFVKPQPYPIKTYIDYGLDEDPKEEYKIDPISPMIEFLGTIGANQQVWIQYIVRAHKKDKRKKGTLFDMVDSWKKTAEEEINKILLRDPKTKLSISKDSEGKTSIAKITKGEEEVVTALERSITKMPFDVGIRALYIAQKEDGKSSFSISNIGGIIGSFKQFATENLNSFKPTNGTGFDYPWQDFMNIRRNQRVAMKLDAFKRRSFFFAPYVGTSIVMNTEELATVFHFPGQMTASAPGLPRILYKKSEPPANLPT